MAYCPKCQGEIAANEVKCAKCGYDFPPTVETDERQGLAYSTFAEICLVIGAALAAIFAILQLVGSVVAVAHGELYSGLVERPVIAIASFIVFIAMEKLRRL